MPKAKPLPTQELLRKLLDYDPETGALIWRERTPDMFTAATRSAEWQCKNWNSGYVGKPALNSLAKHGYLRGTLLQKHQYAHRIIWKWMTGEEPNIIDHINGTRNDNHWKNLRSGSQSQNMQNARMRSNNTSGTLGVTWHTTAQIWTARIQINNHKIFLGNFNNIKDAIAARKAAEIKYGFHPNHGCS